MDPTRLPRSLVRANSPDGQQHNAIVAARLPQDGDSLFVFTAAGYSQVRAKQIENNVKPPADVWTWQESPTT